MQYGGKEQFMPML